MYRSFLSWRYLCGRRTNLIGIIGIFVAVSALILILSIMTGFLEESRRTVRGSLSDLIVQPYFGSAYSKRSVPRTPEPLLQALRADERVAAAAPQLVWGGIITQRGRDYERILSSQMHSDLLAVQLVGVDVHSTVRLSWPVLRTVAAMYHGALPAARLQDELDSTLFFESLQGSREGLGSSLGVGARVDSALFPFQPPVDYEPEGRPKAGVVIGEQLYRSLRIEPGDTIQIATAVPDHETEDFAVNNREFVVTGTFRSGENETDLGRIYLARSELADFLGGSSAFTQVLVRLEDYDSEGVRVRDDLRESLGEAELILGGTFAQHEVRTWEEFRGNLLGAIENERVLMGIMLSLVLVVAGFTVFAILSMMVTEKRRDIGILQALGATPKGILDLFLMIAFWDALLGAFLGAVAGTWAAIEIDSIERWLSSTFGIQIFNRDVYLFDHIPSIVEPLSVSLIVLGAFLCALLFAAIPAWRAARMDPLDALRYE